MEQVAFDGRSLPRNAIESRPLAPVAQCGTLGLFRDDTPVLYTSLERDGAIAELAYPWGLLTPAPTRTGCDPSVCALTDAVLRPVRADLTDLGVDIDDFASLDWLADARRSDLAVAFLECDGLIVPSARFWQCENLVIFTDNQLRRPAPGYFRCREFRRV